MLIADEKSGETKRNVRMSGGGGERPYLFTSLLSSANKSGFKVDSKCKLKPCSVDGVYQPSLPALILFPSGNVLLLSSRAQRGMCVRADRGGLSGTVQGRK